MSNNIVGLMAKHPEIGKVKTRLAKSIGEKNALLVYRSLLDTVKQNCVSHDHNFQITAVVYPGKDLKLFQEQFQGFNHYLPQSGNTLGERMQRTFEIFFNENKADKAILIGADIPDINSDIIEQAFTLLDKVDLVYGPAKDGGYYLIGMNSLHHCLFSNIEWGTDKVLQKSLELASHDQLSYTLLPILQDIDTITDLKIFPDLYDKIK